MSDKEYDILDLRGETNYSGDGIDIKAGSDSGHISNIGMVDATIPDSNMRIDGYVTAIKTGQRSETLSDMARLGILAEKAEAEKEVEKLLDIAQDIIDNCEKYVIVENLFEGLNECLEELWSHRDSREREFSKLIILMQSITKSFRQKVFEKEQLQSINECLQCFKNSRIVELDIQKCREKIKKTKLNIYTPLFPNGKFKIIISEEK